MSQHNAEYHRRWRVENRERLLARKHKSYAGCHDISRQRFELFIATTATTGATTEQALALIDATFPFPQDSYEQQRLARGE